MLHALYKIRKLFNGRTICKITFIAVLAVFLLTCDSPAFAQCPPLDPKFEQTTLSEGMVYYTDRTYTLSSVPLQYVGLDMIKTPNDDKNLAAASGYMTFELLNDATVYVAYDQRAGNLPDWMSGFVDTGDIINTSQSGQGWFNVYSKPFSGGECVDFGGNKGPGSSAVPLNLNNYFVFHETLSGGNQEPNGVIDMPVGNQIIAVGGTVSFAGTGTDPDGNLPLTHLWNFGLGSGIADSIDEDPGVKTFNAPGAFTVTYTVTDNLGFADSTPSTVIITVSSMGCSLDPKFEQTTLSEGMVYYTDRTYTLPSVPLQYVGLDMIKTPNEDKNLTGGSDYMTFELPNDATVYVAYDQRAGNLPDWMSGFVDTGDIINTSQSVQGGFNIYSRQFSSGECFDFGGNKGPGSSAGLLNNYFVFYGTLSGGNQEPNGVIDTPVGNQTITVGDSMSFAGTGTDPDGNLPLTHLWNFGLGSGIADSIDEDPGVKTFNAPGAFTVTYTVTDNLGFADSTPSTVIITVSSMGCSLDPKFEQTTLSEGMVYYTDRTYTLPSVPLQYVGLDMIKTPNEDKNLTGGSDYMTFELPNDATVYVAYDQRAGNLPDWMSGFVDTGDIINTSQSVQGGFNIYSRQFSSGECFDFGGNKGPGSSAGLLNNYFVFYGTLSGGNQEPNGVIDTPVGNQTITVGDSMSFAGTGTDPDGNLPLTHLWNFGLGSGIADSIDEDPGVKTFNAPGAFTVTYTVTDNLGFADSTPSTVIITVSSMGCSLDPKFEQATLSEGMVYYTDRTYTLPSVPLQYVGLDMIKTPNNDKNNADASDYMTFELLNDATVYVAYDQRAGNLPDWMSGFVDTGDIINTSQSGQGWFNVYSKPFSGGECVDFGGNKGPGSSAVPLNNYFVFYGQAKTFLFSDNFNDGDANGWSVIDDSGNLSDWQVVNGVYEQLNAFGGSTFDESYHTGLYSFLSSGAGLTDYRFSVEVAHVFSSTESPTRNNDVGIMFRYTDNNNYYRLSLNARYGFMRLEKRVDGVFTPLATNARGYNKGELLNIEIEVFGNLVFVNINGDSVFGVSDSSHSSGTIALYCQGKTKFDNVLVDLNNPGPTVVISKPHAYSVSTTNTDVIDVSAFVTNLPPGGKVQFVLDDVTVVDDSAPPYTAQFIGVSQGDHKVEAILYDSGDVELVRDTNLNVGILGDYIVCLGDSINNGSTDTFSADNISQDLRIISIFGFESNLNDLLNAGLSPQPNIVFNEAIPGDRSFDTANVRIDSILQRHPKANKVLILLGINDSGGTFPVSSTTYKNNMQDLVNAVVNDGKTAIVGLVVPHFGAGYSLTSSRNVLIQEYNQAISNDLTNIDIGPDFFSFFLSQSVDRLSLMHDSIHPNGLGHVTLAHLWDNMLTGANNMVFILDNLSPLNYKQNLIEGGDTYYIDETHTLTNIPSGLDSGVMVLTANADKNNSSNNFLSFDVDRDVTVYIAYDSGATVLPTWLSNGFSITNPLLQLSTTDPAATSFDLYSALFLSGETVTLGGNLAGGADANVNYTVIIVEN